MTPDQDLNGISLVICTYNGETRLPKAMEAIAKLKKPTIPLELVLINNNSSDRTVAVAKETWMMLSDPFELKIVDEPKPGTMHARRRGVYEAKYDLLLYVDDDNYLEEDYLIRTWEIMQSHPECVGCGGGSFGVFDDDPPEWFEKYALFYAVGFAQEKEGYVENGFMLTAGLALRRPIVQSVFDAGFENQLVGRSSTSMVAGEDMELTYFLSLLGYRFWYDPKLVFHHYMDPNRLTRPYLKKLVDGIGIAKALLMPYEILHKQWHTSLKGTKTYQLFVHLAKFNLVFFINPYGRERKFDLSRIWHTIKTLCSPQLNFKERISQIQQQLVEIKSFSTQMNGTQLKSSSLEE